MDTTITYRVIGVIHSTHTDPHTTPIQGVYAAGSRGWIELLPEFADALTDLEGFSHLFLLYDFHRAKPGPLMLKPFLQNAEHGVFATRAPSRPNRIGLSIVTFLYREGTTLHVDRVDILDGTPLLDIKPYITRFDRIDKTRDGWQDDIDEDTARTLGERNPNDDASRARESPPFLPPLTPERSSPE